MNKPKTLEEALRFVPEYILLRPGVDRLRFYDELWSFNCLKKEWFVILPDTDSAIWLNPASHAIYETGELIARRPIPQTCARRRQII